MSERNMREPAKAYTQLVEKLEKKLNRLNLHSWPGAVRTAHLPVFTAMSTTPQTILSLKLTSGRWVVKYRGVCTIDAAIPGSSLNLRAVSEGAVIVSTRWRMDGVVGVAIIPFNDFGEIIVPPDVIANIDLQVSGQNVGSSTWANLSLMCQPV